MSLLTTQQITLDLTVPRVQNVRCVQDDQNTRLVRIVVTNNGEPFPLNPETMIISYKVCKPDSHYVWNKTGVTINDDGTVTVDLSDQALAITGIAKSALRIQEGPDKISTLPFHIIVEKAVVGNDELISESESDILDEMESHLTDYNNPHKTDAEQVGLGNVPNVTTNDQTPTYAEAAELTPLTSGETLSAAFGKLAKAVTELITHLSDKFIHITDEERTSWNAASDQKHTHGNQNVLDSISSASISNWNDKYTKNEVDNKFSTLETNIDWKESVNTYDDIATAYPSPQDGWTVNVKDTDYTYRYNGLEWVAISANAIPKATADIDGLMSKEDKTTLDNLSGGSVTGVKGAAETNYRQGNINLTPENIGLGNVPNVATNDQTPTYAPAGALTPLTSGEKLSAAFGKLAKAVTELISHISVKATQTAANQHPLGHVQVYDTIPDITASNQCIVPSIFAVAAALRGKADSSHTHSYLPSSYVVNNNTTTVAGYALDARQANASIAGTLAADIQNCLKSVSDGKSTVANAITAQGVSTATTATFQTMAANIATAASAKYSAGYNAGVSATKKGTAAAAQVLTGYTFTNNSGVRISGTMTNRGAVSKTFTPSGSSQSYTIPAGYHNGSGKVTCNATNIVKDTNTMSIPIYKYSASSTDYQFSTSLSNFKDMYDNIVITPGSPGATVIFTKSDESTVTKKITAATTYAISSYTKVVIKNTNDGYSTVKIKFSND